MPTIATYRKQAKLLVRWHREKNYSVGEKVRMLERFRSFTDREALEMNLPLTLAQEIIAVEAGYKSWPELKLAASGAPKMPRRAGGPALLKDAIPILLVRDVKVCATFFEQKLGFQVDFLHGLPPFYGAVSRDGVRLHIRYVQQPVFAEIARREKSLLCASFEVSNVQDLFEEFKARRVEFVQALTRQPWRGTDFQVRDPDGNVISFVTYASERAPDRRKLDHRV
jgi:catechol 2,3-dioxygenase-like lactoylglutathione lyase family enzyme